MGIRAKHAFTIDGNPSHFASSIETIRIRLAPFPGNKKVDGVWLKITDRGGKSVFEEAWPKEGSPVPPSLFEWQGLTTDGKTFATPLGSPYEITVEAELSDAEKLAETPKELTASTSKPVSCPLIDHCAVTEIVAKAGAAKSTSYDFTQSGIEKLVVAGGRAGRFFYAFSAEPGDEPPLKIGLKFIHPQLIAEAKLFLFNSKDAVIWQKVLPPSSLSAEMDYDGAEISALLTVKDAPYKLKISIEGPTVEKRNIAWTFLDVIVESIELVWGSARLLPPATPNLEQLCEEAILLRGLKDIAPAQPTPRTEGQALTDDDGAGEKPVKAGKIELELTSNTFYQDPMEWAMDTGFLAYQAIWGAGPRFPLLAKIKVRSSAGKGVNAPKALEGTSLLWDWEDPKLDKRDGVETSDWLAWAMERYGHDGDEFSPVSTNCHAEFGGKRGQAADPVFPPQDGSGNFPFAVEAFQRTRPWAALSKAMTAGKYAGYSGVLFQPSRIGGDCYRVRAYVYTEDPEDFHYSLNGDSLSKAAVVAGLPSAVSGEFEIWRRVDVLQYFKKGATLPAIDIGEINNRLKPARIRLYLGANDPTALTKVFDTELRKIFASTDQNYKNILNVMAPLDEQQASPFALKLRSWDELASQAVLDGMEAYAVSLKKDSEKLRIRTLRGHVDTALVGKWRKAFELVNAEDRAGMDKFVRAAFPQNSDRATATAVSVFDSLQFMGQFLGSARIRISYNKAILLPAITAYANGEATLNQSKSPLGGQAGLFVVHFGAVFPGQQDLSGAAAAIGKGKAERGRGLFFFAYPPVPDDRLVIDPTSGGKDIVPWGLPITLSATFKADYAQDYEALLHCIANASVYRAAALVITAEKPDDVAGSLGGQSLVIKAQSRNAGLFGAAATALTNAISLPTINKVAHKHSDVYLSLNAAFDKAFCAKISFSPFSKKLDKKQKLRILEFIRDAYNRWPFRLRDMYLYYEVKSDTGTARGVAVETYLRASLTTILGAIKVNPGPTDSDCPAVYDLNSLFAHELGHTLFTPHADPEDGFQAWRHVPAYPCLMNYNPAHTEFCGFCMLALRGWDIGKADAQKLDGGPPWNTTAVGPKVAKVRTAEELPPVIEELLQPRRVEDGWEHAGYHGAAAIHHDSMAAGLKPIESKWDPSSGGELGPGFYLTEDFGTACLYGTMAAQLHSCDVEVWEVEWRSDVTEWGDGFAVPLTEHWGKIKEAYCKPPFDYLTNAGEDPIFQYKINTHALDKVRVLNSRRMSVDEAFRSADSAKAVQKPQDKTVPRVKVQRDGDCFFHSVSFWIKASEQIRTPYLAGAGTYGADPSELTLATAVRREVADWLAMEIFGKATAAAITDNEVPSTVNGARYLNTWNLLTSNGTDIVHFGRNIAETIKNLPLNHTEAATATKELIWGDAGFLWRAIETLYGRRLCVHIGGATPVIFGDAGDLVHIIHSGLHYDVVRPDSNPEVRS